MRVRIILDTYSDVEKFFQTVATIPDGKIELVNDNNQYRVNARSYLSCLLAHTEWGKDGIWLESDSDLYSNLQDWILNEADDGAFIHN